MKGFGRGVLLALVVSALFAGVASGQEVKFKDPTGDDNGPGTYTYPTDGVYTKGSFDLTEFKLKVKGDRASMDVCVNANLEDPWRMGVGFSVQMVFIFIDTDGKEGSGHTEGLPGLNVQFDPKSAWDKAIIISPQQSSRVNQEVQSKAEALAGDIIVPTRVRGSGRCISASVSMADLGGGDPTTWGYQVLMQSNEGFPDKNDLLTRKVNEYEGQHRFGGGTDYDCDPHVMDCLGDPSMLSYECGPDGSSVKMATLSMVKPE